MRLEQAIFSFGGQGGGLQPFEGGFFIEAQPVAGDVLGVTVMQGGITDALEGNGGHGGLVTGYLLFVARCWLFVLFSHHFLVTGY